MSDKPTVRLADRRPPKPLPEIPLQILEGLLQDVRSGQMAPDALCVIHRTPQADGSMQYGIWRSDGVSRDEMIGILYQGINMLVKEEYHEEPARERPPSGT